MSVSDEVQQVLRVWRRDVKGVHDVNVVLENKEENVLNFFFMISDSNFNMSVNEQHLVVPAPHRERSIPSNNSETSC